MRLLAAVLLLAAPAGAVQLTEADFRAGLADWARYRRDEFVKAGLAPIEQVAAERREVRRFQLSVWLPNRIPAVEVERRRDGDVVIRTARAGQAVTERVVPGTVWTRLIALDAVVFAKPQLADVRPWDERIASGHGDRIALEGSRRGKVLSAGGGQCVGSLETFGTAKRAVVAIYADALLDVEPGCRTLARDDSTAALIECFSGRPAKVSPPAP